MQSSDKVTIYSVPTGSVDEALQRHGALIDLALENGGHRYTLPDLRIACLEGAMQMFVAELKGDICGVLVTQIVQYPCRRVLQLAFMAGVGINEMLPYANIFDRFARDMDADELEIVGRVGWRKVMGDDWKTGGIILRKDLH
jgi:hypothetical protein